MDGTAQSNGASHANDSTKYSTLATDIRRAIGGHR